MINPSEVGNSALVAARQLFLNEVIDALRSDRAAREPNYLAIAVQAHAAFNSWAAGPDKKLWRLFLKHYMKLEDDRGERSHIPTYIRPGHI